MADGALSGPLRPHLKKGLGSITPEQLQPERVILEVYDNGLRQRDSTAGLWFRIVRHRPEGFDACRQSTDGTLETQRFASDDAWIYSVETLPGKRYEPIACGKATRS